MDTFHWHLQTHQRRMDQTPQTGPSKTTKRKLSPPAGPSPKQQRTVSPPPKTHQEKSRVAPIDARVVLPNHISRNKAVVALVGGSNEPHGDNLCFFRCLAVHRGTPNVQALEAPTKTYYRQYLQQQDMTSRVWRWMIWWYWGRFSGWTCMSTTYKKQKLVTSQLGWYEVPPTALKIQWIWICMKTTSATSVIWRNTVTATRVWNVTGCGNMLGRCTDMNGSVRGVLPHSSMCRT
jgi:hypothetical protein